ncbi:MAG: YggS family pyridoxal phosphate-dependent enzyme [Clostridia bacterium]|nr:YggS family pyridoxal phosphate-dependent enzyme [Clostridia bacterium]
MLKTNVERVLSDIKAGNNYGEKITLVAATKTQDAEVINRAIEYGVKVVAENRVQEFTAKTQLIRGADQQFIGRLQTNKVKYLVGKVSLIQSIDSIHLAKAVSEEAVKKKVTQDILLEINAGEELSKAGFSAAEIPDAIKEISAFPNLSVKGFMAMMPQSKDEEFLAGLFDKTRALYDGLKEEYSLSVLSMGMSEDYKIAVKHGSNMIRIGSEIFGKRNYGEK